MNKSITIKENHVYLQQRVFYSLLNAHMNEITTFLWGTNVGFCFFEVRVRFLFLVTIVFVSIGEGVQVAVVEQGVVAVSPREFLKLDK